MIELPPGHVRVLVDRPWHPALEDAARTLAAGQSPARSMDKYPRSLIGDRLVVEQEFGAVPIGSGDVDQEIRPPALLTDQNGRYLVRALLELDGSAGVPERIGDGRVYADPPIGGHLTCGSSRAVGDTCCVHRKLDTATLAAHGLDGSGVAIAICDSGIYRPHLTRQLGFEPNLDEASSWQPSTLATTAGMHRLGHGTMCAYDALIAAPKATLLDIPILRAREPGDHSARGTIGAAMQGYWWLIAQLISGQVGKAPLVVNNSWGILHPSLDLPPAHPGRYVDNLHHVFRLYVRVLTFLGADILFAASNCGADCPSAVCLGEKQGMIMGANAYPEVLTLAGCDVTDARVGYSSRGPSIPGMPPEKPDLTAYTHFLGSKAFRSFLPDSGTSAACAVAAGCVAALRTRPPPGGSKSPTDMLKAFKTTARHGGAPGWNPDLGHGVIRPVAVGRSLGLIP